MSLAWGLALALLLAAPAAAAQEVAIPPPGTGAWQPLTFPKVERHTRYTPAEEDGRPVLVAESECSASGLVYPLGDFDLERTPLLRWRWRVDEALAPADERVRGGDDFAARVYVSFVFEPERASLFERTARRLAAAVWGETMPGRALSYVWASREPPGALWPNPYTDASQMIARASGGPGDWREAEADLLADHQRAFGQAAPAPLFLALMTDTDDRCTRARARYADFRFAPR